MSCKALTVVAMQDIHVECRPYISAAPTCRFCYLLLEVGVFCLKIQDLLRGYVQNNAMKTFGFNQFSMRL